MRALWAILPTILLASCGPGGGRKTLNRRISLLRHDDIPYGTKVAYDLLPHIFPGAGIVVNTNSSPASYNSASGPGGSSSYITNRAYIIIGTSVVGDDQDVTALMSLFHKNQNFRAIS